MSQTTPVIFSYQKNSSGQFFPIIPVTLSFRKKKADTSALIDSGATISIFQDDLAKDLGIEIESGREIFLGGVGGRIKGYMHRLNTEIAGKKIFLPLVFSHEYLASFNLLGRNAFFEKFLIVFNEKKKELKLE